MTIKDKPLLPTYLAKLMLARVIRLGDMVIDATCGNGHDTLFLAESVGETGKVLAFDVQDPAIEAARKRVAAAGCEDRVIFFRESHARLADRAAPHSVTAVMFNLGYLPGNDHTVATGDDTMEAIESAIMLLRSGGAISVICYPGHVGGAAEANAVEERLARLGDDKWRVVKYQALGTLSPAPYLVFAVRP
ncbi:methyltransferase domain-containing protein [Luteolibacter pohnpeiensis]|uniref:Methyltransferase domain-containing protein n=1 Tax=Luteolibacter pohnpeiensis TaxID=454153 RepID=A0A934SA14_9BACT|nr:class I SAM-dependent methyltransferase [Luteolibacter pohnpeiensis]MBK1882402.1 methyltransferase domain-containing protein [Luteolibacter pohnpeiensis]